MATINLNVEGMSCGGCEKSISKALMTHAGVSSVDANHSTGVVAIEFDDTQIQQGALEQAIEDAGFDVAA